MTQPVDFAQRARDRDSQLDEPESVSPGLPAGVPSNEVYARVGDVVLHAAQDGVRRGLPPQDIIRDIVAAHDVRLNLGELRLLLASRRIPQ